MLFQFNFYSSLLLLAFLQGILYAGLLAWRAYREERRSDAWLAVLLLLCCIDIANWMLGFAHWYDARDWHTTFMFYFPWDLHLFIGPAIYFYFHSLTNPDFRLERRHYGFLLPGAFLLLLYLGAFTADIVVGKWWLDRPLDGFYGTRGPYGQLSIPLISEPWFEIGWIFFFLILTIRSYRRYQVYIREHFSDTGAIAFVWLRNLLIAITAVISLVAVVSLTDAWIIPLDYDQFWFGYLAVAVMIYYLSIAGHTAALRVKVILDFSPETAVEEEAKLASPGEDDELEHWRARILEYADRESPHLRPNLTLREMAAELETNPSVLSRLINRGFDQNFNDFINARRVEAVKQRMQKSESRQRTLLALALDSGFNSKATFNRAFRKFTGQSPSAYWRELQNKK